MHRLRQLLEHRLAAVILPVCLGVIFARLVAGAGPLNPSNTAWLFGDTATYYTAWEEYRHESHLHFPLTWTERVGYPVGASIALLDAIPLAAVLLRPLNSLLPEPFQYLGIWMVLSLVLQAYFSLSLCRRLFSSDVLFAWLASFFLFVSPPLVYRICEHIALTSHWLILAAFDAYFRDPSGRPVRWLVRAWIVAALAAAISPYIAAMCAIIGMGSVLRLVLERHCRWWQGVLFAAATVGIVVGSGAAFGVLTTADSGALWAPGYGLFSLNLDAPFNSLAPQFPCCVAHPPAVSIVLPALPLAHFEQYEGYSYLGLGTIALLVVYLARRPSALLWLTRPALMPLVGVAVVCTVLAASTSITLGTRTLFTIHWPTRVDRMLEGLRASGRLFWPAYYLILVSTLALVYWIAKPRHRTAVVTLALAVQLVDLAPLYARTRGVCNARFENLLRSPTWNGLGRRYDNLIMIPAYQCDPYQAAGGLFTYVYFGKLAAIEGMRSNSYYAARYTHAQLQAHCVDLLRTQLHGNVDPRSAYVVTDPVRQVWEVDGVRSVRCQVVDGNNLCTPVPPPQIDTRPAAPSAAAPFVPGTVLDFTAPNGNARRYETFGWGNATAEGTWTEGPLAVLRMGTDASQDPVSDLVFDMDAVPFLVAPGHPRLDVDLVVNGQPIATWTYDQSSRPRRVARLPVSVLSTRHEIDVEFWIGNPESPQFVGASTQSRFIGLNVRSIRVHRY